ncbi:uncharacterized protein [Panulirus ornatus]|uniref:uncharacterized protein isoform X2 n=1 Tax=Panulirus ornatus TaxID=150431 RepID=UPI003A88F93F
MGLTLHSPIRERRFHMGWLQLKRWLSFLPVAFVVYILLHYFVYQPDLSGPHAALLVSGRRSNESVVSVAGGRTLQSGPRVLPPLAQDTVQPELSLTSDLPSSKEPPSAAEGTSGRRNDNATLSQGSGATYPFSPVRFDSESRALLGDPSRDQLQEDPGVVVGGSEARYLGSGSASRGDVGTASTRPEASVAVPIPLEEVGSVPLATPDSSTALLRRTAHISTPRPALRDTAGPPRGRVPMPPYVPEYGNVSPGWEGAAPPSHRTLPRYDHLNLAYTYQGREAYDHQPRGYAYNPYGASYSKERAVQRALYAHRNSLARMGGFPQVGNDLSPVYDPFAYPGGRDLTMGKQLKPSGGPGLTGQSAQVSTIQEAPSSASASPKNQAQQRAKLKATGLVPQPKQTVTKKTALKKSNVSLSTNLAISALKGKIKVGEKYESGFSVPHEELCENNGRDLKVLVLITTAPDHEKHRTAVRQTWGHFTVRKDVVMVFVIGRTTDANIQSNIDRENELYGDIIQANFIDHYSNLTLKTISMFEWVKTYCSESHFILKTDDDMFINMPLLFSFIDSKTNDQRVMYGRMAKGWKPVRNKKSKYYIDTNTYSKTKYPDFLTGPAYLFTNDVVDEIYQKALDTTFFVLEDVLVTGFVGESLRIRRIGDSRFRNEKIKVTDTCNLIKTISTHMVKYEEQFDFYKRTLDGKAKCKTG